MHNFIISPQCRPPKQHSQLLPLFQRKLIQTLFPLSWNRKNQKMTKNLDDLWHHVSKQVTGRAPTMPALRGVRQPSPPDCSDKVNRELNHLPEDEALVSTLVTRAYHTKVPKTIKVQAQLIDPNIRSSSVDPRFRFIYPNYLSPLAFMPSMNGTAMTLINTQFLMILPSWTALATQLGTHFYGWIVLYTKANLMNI